MQLTLTHDFELVKARYIDVIENTPGIERYARWNYGKHPTDESIRSYIDNGEMYLMMDEGNVAGMVAIVMHQGSDYETVRWAEKLSNEQVSTLHLLAVVPDYRGQSLGRRILQEAIKLSAKNGKKAVRLDTLKTNLPARHLYDKAGFFYRGEQYLYAENTGWIDFLYYEKPIC